MKHYIDPFLFIYFIFWGVFVYFIGSHIVNSELTYALNKVDVYEKILNREYDRTFESFEDYLLYRIETGK